MTPTDDRGRREPDDELEQLADGARRGRREDLEELLERDGDRLVAVCRRVLRDEELAADAAQEAMLSIARHIRTFDGRSRYTTWSYRIAVNAALDEARRAGRRKTLPLKETAVEETISFEGAVSTRIGVAQALERLPAEQSEALRLRHGLDLDYAEIAEILHVPIGTVRSRLARGRVQLAALLRDEDRAISRLERNRPSSGDVEELT